MNTFHDCAFFMFMHRDEKLLTAMDNKDLLIKWWSTSDQKLAGLFDFFAYYVSNCCLVAEFNVSADKNSASMLHLERECMYCISETERNAYAFCKNSHRC